MGCRTFIHHRRLHSLIFSHVSRGSFGDMPSTNDCVHLTIDVARAILVSGGAPCRAGEALGRVGYPARVFRYIDGLYISLLQRKPRHPLCSNPVGMFAFSMITSMSLSGVCARRSTVRGTSRTNCCFGVRYLPTAHGTVGYRYSCRDAVLSGNWVFRMTLVAYACVHHDSLGADCIFAMDDPLSERKMHAGSHCAGDLASESRTWTIPSLLVLGTSRMHLPWWRLPPSNDAYGNLFKLVLAQKLRFRSWSHSRAVQKHPH